jgi:hypothetical protein
MTKVDSRPDDRTNRESIQKANLQGQMGLAWIEIIRFEHNDGAVSFGVSKTELYNDWDVWVEFDNEEEARAKANEIFLTTRQAFLKRTTR